MYSILINIILLVIIAWLLYSRYRMKKQGLTSLQESRRELDQKDAYLETLHIEQEKLLKEKEWLIKEVHHRVKNNLQMVTSLLYSQSVYSNNEATKRALNDSLHRMQAMSLIHQKLYEDQNTSVIAMPEYVQDLVSYLHDSFDTDERITFEKNIDALYLDVSQAIPLGLIITESVVNAIKYAFLNGQKGTVNINLQRNGTEGLLLKIWDNGNGLPAAPEQLERNSLGLELMQGLARQLNGTFKIENNNGVHITVICTIVKNGI